jgi:hypothetical protein
MIGRGSDSNINNSSDFKEHEDETIEMDMNMNSTCPVLTSTDPFTKGMSKSARNRYYAQTSRARHRQYVANLEKDREMLMERLEKIEEDNRRMRDEIFELRISNKRTRTTDCHDKAETENFSIFTSNSTNIYSVKANDTNNNDFIDNPFLKQAFKSYSTLNTSFNNNYALSVLDFLVFPRFPEQEKQLPSSINSPRSLNPIKFKAPHFLVDLSEVKRKDPMNWRDNYYRQKVISKKKRKKQRCHVGRRERNRLILIRLVKLAKLKIYLQQFGNTI